MSSLFSPEEKSRVLNAYFDSMSDPVPFVPNTLAAWNRRRESLRPALANLLGLYPFPDRVSLDVHVTGELDEGDYTITRLYWQSWEGFYASGWLYRPRDIATRLPAVLNPHGHWANGARHPTVQSRMVGLAKQGYVALAVDSVHVTDFPIGLCSLTVMTWNNIRALDLLCSLDEVDSERIGCTGASGGGQQTMYLAALDDRVAATVNVCLVTYFKKILFPSEQTHCICNHVPGLLAQTDEPEICALIAPRPSLYLCVTQDWTRNFPQEEFPELAEIYSLFGAREHVHIQQWDWQHDYHQPMRERMYAWFNHYLKNDGAPERVPEPELSLRTPDELAALSGVVPNSRPWDEFPRYYRSLNAMRGGPLTNDRLLRLLGGDRRRIYLEPELYLRRRDRVEVVTGFKGFPISVDILQPEHASAHYAILIHPEGRDAVDRSQAMTLRERGWTVLIPDVRLRGEFRIRWDLNATVWGRPEVGMATDDVLALIHRYAVPLEDFETLEVACVGFGEYGIVALIAASLDGRVRHALAPELGRTFLNGRTTSVIANLLRYGDIPDLVALCTGARVSLGGIPEAEIPEYRKSGAEILVRPDEWLACLLRHELRTTR
jgi:cephalosporin-C deacetylase-like acetyl esterase